MQYDKISTGRKMPAFALNNDTLQFIFLNPCVKHSNVSKIGNGYKILWWQIYSEQANIINCIDENIRVELGKSTPSAGESSFQALEKAVSDLQKEVSRFKVSADPEC